MENMVKEAFWPGKKVFITGHTGFKGSWLAFWLLHLGAYSEKAKEALNILSEEQLAIIKEKLYKGGK